MNAHDPPDDRVDLLALDLLLVESLQPVADVADVLQDGGLQETDLAIDPVEALPDLLESARDLLSHAREGFPEDTELRTHVLDQDRGSPVDASANARAGGLCPLFDPLSAQRHAPRLDERHGPTKPRAIEPMLRRVADETLDAKDLKDLARTLAMDEGTVAELARTVLHSPRSTFAPVVRIDPAGQSAVANLASAAHAVMSGLTMERTLGQGGMGIVRLATQRSLGRKVAVKTLRPEIRGSEATLRLLREAWVTGTLEHPNIVPVYDLGIDEDGAPLIVLKKIDGESWEALIHDASRVAARFDSLDLIVYNLRILAQLCNAVSLAHAHGIVHRDLKPENVMIGAFGEVYLVDWGVAVSLAADPEGRLPVVQPGEVAGTPCYMAPEMIEGAGNISPRTDVYLLGGILHEILTGRPPHDGDLKKLIASILRSTFVYADHVPQDLAAIAQRAMARDPEARFGSADLMKKAIEHYLERRGSLALSAEAERRLVALRGAITAGAPREEVYALAVEGRFGFRQATAAFGGNEQAATGLRETIETLVRYELMHGTAEAAAAALTELRDPPEELAREVRDALAARTADRERLAHLERLDAALDPRTGRQTRLVSGFFVTASWLLVPLAGPWLEARVSPRYHYLMMYVMMSVAVAVSRLVGRAGRRSLATVVNRRLQAIIVIALAIALTLEVACRVLGVSFGAMVVLHFVVWFHAACVSAAVVDRRLWGVAISYALGLAVACLRPEWRWWCLSLAHVGVFLSIAHAWGRPERNRPARGNELGA